MAEKIYSVTDVSVEPDGKVSMTITCERPIDYIMVNLILEIPKFEERFKVIMDEVE